MTLNLLKAVLNRTDIEKIDEDVNDKIWYTIEGDTLSSFATKTKLFFQLKDWAKKHKYYIWSGYDSKAFAGYGASIYKDDFYATDDDFISDSNTEYDSVVMACEWVLGEIDG